MMEHDNHGDLYDSVLVTCEGTENRLSQCDHTFATCIDREDAGTICNGKNLPMCTN